MEENMNMIISLLREGYSKEYKLKILCHHYVYERTVNFTEEEIRRHNSIFSDSKVIGTIFYKVF